jgi:hypothetical protein
VHSIEYDLSGGGHLVADLLLLLEQVAFGRVAAEAGLEVRHVLGLLKFGLSFIAHHRCDSFPNSDFPDAMAYLEDTTQDTKPNVETKAPASGLVIQPVDCLAR